MHLSNNTLLQRGKYRIIRFINKGGFGCTYEAEHTLFNTHVAIKEFFKEDMCNRDERTNMVSVGVQSKVEVVAKLKKKFMEEATAVFQMRHPGIVRVIDIFEENGTAYYVMDFIDGCSLEDLVERHGRLPEREALGYILQVADALQYVHGCNRLHLDIKPNNIMVDRHGKAILIDFGASKHYNENSGKQDSTLLGINTPGYTPVEQAARNFSKFNPATDIYALGATLYKLLTAITPMASILRADEGDENEIFNYLPSSLSASTRKAVIAAMQIKSINRPQNIEEFKKILGVNTTYGERPYQKEESEDTVYDEQPKETVIEQTVSDNDYHTEYKEKSSSNKYKHSVEVPSSTKSSKKKNAVWVIFAILLLLVGCFFASILPTTDQNNISSDNTINGHEYVDLGLSVKWATCNIGASGPSDNGDYFAWGEILTKSEYTIDNSITYEKSIVNISGNPKYDAASANWGGTWRMPKDNEILELVEKCERKWTAQNGRNGYLVTGPNGKSIFIPAAGSRYNSDNHNMVDTIGGYWGSFTICDSLTDCCLFFNDSVFERISSFRSIGLAVRPVSD